MTTSSWFSAIWPPPNIPGMTRLRRPPSCRDAGRSEEEQAALTLAAGLLEHLARLPERDHLPDLLLRLVLPAHVAEPDAPVGVAGLVALDLHDPHQRKRAHEDEEVGDEEEADH